MPAALSRHVVAQLTTGGFLLFAGALFSAPFLLSSGASGNDVFLTNLFLAPLISLLGGLLYILALRRLGLSFALMLILIAINVTTLTQVGSESPVMHGGDEWPRWFDEHLFARLESV